MNNIFKLVITFFLIVALNAKAQLKTQFGDYSIEYNVENGMFNGDYESYYKNGQLRVTGRFKNNARIGIWQAWDSSGVLQIKRNYTSAYTYDKIVPKIPKDGPIPLLSEFPYELNRDSNNFYIYYSLKESSIVWLKRIISKAPIDHNSSLIKPSLLDTITNLIKQKKITVYDTIDAEFSQKFLIENLNSAPYILDHFLFVSETLFDNERYLMETRIIGFCPVIKTNTGLKKLFWVYYPALKPHLKNSISSSLNYKYIDDIIFYNAFHNVIIREGFKNSSPIKTDLESVFPNRINFELIEVEHSLWMKFHKVLKQ